VKKKWEDGWEMWGDASMWWDVSLNFLLFTSCFLLDPLYKWGNRRSRTAMGPKVRPDRGPPPPSGRSFLLPDFAVYCKEWNVPDFGSIRKIYDA
jgi:hypothetical protein